MNWTKAPKTDKGKSESKQSNPIQREFISVMNDSKEYEPRFLHARTFIMFLPGCVHSSYAHMFSYVSIYHNTHFWTRYPNIGTGQTLT